MHEQEIVTILKLYNDRSMAFLESDRIFREARASFLLSMFDPAVNPKRKTEKELDALVDGNAELNNLKLERDKNKVLVEITKYQLDLILKEQL